MTSKELYSEEDIANMCDDALYSLRHKFSCAIKFASPYDKQYKELVTQYNMFCRELYNRGNCDV